MVQNMKKRNNISSKEERWAIGLVYLNGVIKDVLSIKSCLFVLTVNVRGYLRHVD